MSFGKFILSFIIAWVIWAPFMAMFMKKGAYTPKSEMLRAEAIAAGRVVTGRLVRKKAMRYDPEDRGSYVGHAKYKVRYTYAVDGRMYSWSGVTTNDTVPDEVDFYYEQGKSGKAIPDGLTVEGSNVVVLTSVPIVIWVILAWIFEMLF